MHLFIAIDIPQPEKAKIANELLQLKQEYGDFRWEPSTNFHINLHSLGEVPDVGFDRLISHIESIVFEAKPFYLFALHGGIFIRDKITLYLEFQKNHELESLVDTVRTIEVPNQNIYDSFMPHLILARYRIPSKQQYLLIKKKINKFAPDISFEVSKIHLLSCDLSVKNPVYKKVAEFNLH